MKYAALLCLAVSPAFAQLPANLGAAEWYRPPKLTLMVGFIKDPQHKNFTVKQWAAGIGAKFDAEALVARAASAGVTQIIWYDKWIDGLVFRKTKTTTHTTERDFLAPLMAASRKHGVKIVTYFNTFYDGNPEFVQWAAVDQRGKPIAFSSSWPENLLSMFSPFREKALEQIRELVQDYKIDGIWLDVPGYAILSYDKGTREAFQKATGKDMDEATLEDRRRFAVKAAVEWNRDVAAFVRKLNPAVTVTTNEQVDPVVEGPARASSMASVVDYFSTELHTIELQLARTSFLRNSMKPFEVGTLISDDWFTPLNSGPVKSSKSPDLMHIELASVFTAGMNLYLAVTLAHDGSLDESTLKLMDLSGDWLRKRRPYLEGASDINDVAILLGTPDTNALDWPGGARSSETRANAASSNDYNDIMIRLQQYLLRNGYIANRLVNVPPCRSYQGIPAGTRAILIPDRAQLNQSDRQAVEEFIGGGGRVIAFGRGAELSSAGYEEPKPAAGIFGVNGAGYAATDVAVLLGSQRLAVRGPVRHMVPFTASTLVWAGHNRAGDLPFIARSIDVGAGRAFLVAAPEASLLDRTEILDYLMKESVGDPVWRVTPNPARYAVRVRRQQGRVIVHVIDSPAAVEGPMQRYRPLYTTLALNSRLLPFTKATIVPDNRSLNIAADGVWKSMEIFPDPELTIILE